MGQVQVVLTSDHPLNLQVTLPYRGHGRGEYLSWTSVRRVPILWHIDEPDWRQGGRQG